MIVVIQCASTKRPNAGYLRTRDRKPVVFVADPRIAPRNDGYHYARPDEVNEDGETWRTTLSKYNGSNDNTLALFPAYQLYANDAYDLLAERFGVDKLYILSAGWGLVSAVFLTPYYDITFSPSAEAYKRRRRKDAYLDYRMLPTTSDEPITFLGGKDYVPLFCSLTRTAKGKRTVFYNSATAPKADGCTLKRFPTMTRTNWHYECAKTLVKK